MGDARTWQGPRGETVCHATTMHVLGGQCRAIEERTAIVQDMDTGVRAIAAAEQPERRRRAGRGRRGQQRGATSAPIVTRTGSIANIARKAIDGEISRTGAGSAELRMILAGDLPPEAGMQGSGGAHTAKQKAAQAYRVRRIIQG